MSTRWASALPPAFWISSTTDAAASPLMSINTTCAPSAANKSDASRPIPEPAAVITATRSARSPAMSFPSLDVASVDVAVEHGDPGLFQHPPLAFRATAGLVRRRARVRVALSGWGGGAGDVGVDGL